jgi:predicted TIM-barrel fold metal-dependent hydrolase
MENIGISKTILSITDPGTHLVPGQDEQARQLCRQCSEFAADLKRRRPEKFGFWATLPLPDVEGSLAEIAYALDELNADGIGLMTNHHGVYLGDAPFDPVLVELNRRHATVFIHPTIPCMANGHGGQPQNCMPMIQYGPGMFEFFFDETRAVIHLIMSGAAQRNPNITFIVSHAGAALPPLIERFSAFATVLSLGRDINLTADTVKECLKERFFFDLSGMVFPDQIHGLLRNIDKSRLLYGSDYPYSPTAFTIELASRMDKGLREIFQDEESSHAILYGNAERLLGNKHTK